MYGVPPHGDNSWSVITDETSFNRSVPDECHDKGRRKHKTASGSGAGIDDVRLRFQTRQTVGSGVSAGVREDEVAALDAVRSPGTE